MSGNYIGFGFDIHRLIKGKPLVLGGLRLPHPQGLLGHSDGDVLLHAVCDALLGAAGLGDIGMFFPDTDPKFKNIASTLLLRQVMNKIKRKKLRIKNLDTVIFAERPKLGSQKSKVKSQKLTPRTKIRNNLAKILGISKQKINIKAKTMEKLGPIGARKALAATAVVLLNKKN